MIEHSVERDKKIRVYDNLFTAEERGNFYAYANASYFRLGWADGPIVENQSYRFLHSIYSDEDVRNLGIIESIKNTEAAHELDGHKIVKCILNLSTAADANFLHVHPEDKILLYYVNLEWRDGWHGETLFFTENHKDIVFAAPYTPGRLISFNAKIPHTIRPQSHLAHFYRFTLAIILNKC
jgi:hypothetical protein